MTKTKNSFRKSAREELDEPLAQENDGSRLATDNVVSDAILEYMGREFHLKQPTILTVARIRTRADTRAYDDALESLCRRVS